MHAPATVPHAGERPHLCTICKTGFAQSSTLTDHMRTHTGKCGGRAQPPV